MLDQPPPEKDLPKSPEKRPDDSDVPTTAPSAKRLASSKKVTTTRLR